MSLLHPSASKLTQELVALTSQVWTLPQLLRLCCAGLKRLSGYSAGVPKLQNLVIFNQVNMNCLLVYFRWPQQMWYRCPPCTEQWGSLYSQLSSQQPLTESRSHFLLQVTICTVFYPQPNQICVVYSCCSYSTFYPNMVAGWSLARTEQIGQSAMVTADHRLWIFALTWP